MSDLAILLALYVASTLPAAILLGKWLRACRIAEREVSGE